MVGNSSNNNTIKDNVFDDIKDFHAMNLQSADDNYIVNNFENDVNFDTCADCNVEKLILQTEGCVVCPKCGVKDKILIDCILILIEDLHVH